MQFVYRPEGAEPRKWQFDPYKLLSPEVEAIERFTHLPFGEWAEQVGKGSFIAIHGLLYVLLKRQHPTLKWDEVVFCMADIDFEMDADERAEILKDLEAKAELGPLDDGEAAVLRELRELAAEDAADPKENPAED